MPWIERAVCAALALSLLQGCQAAAHHAAKPPATDLRALWPLLLAPAHWAAPHGKAVQRGCASCGCWQRGVPEARSRAGCIGLWQQQASRQGAGQGCGRTCSRLSSVEVVLCTAFFFLQTAGRWPRIGALRGCCKALMQLPGRAPAFAAQACRHSLALPSACTSCAAAGAAHEPATPARLPRSGPATGHVAGSPDAPPNGALAAGADHARHLLEAFHVHLQASGIVGSTQGNKSSGSCHNSTASAPSRPLPPPSPNPAPGARAGLHGIGTAP